MMNDFDITDIERLATEAIRGLGISEHVWNNRPKATDDSIGSFVVVKVTGGITDKAAFGPPRRPPFRSRHRGDEKLQEALGHAEEVGEPPPLD